MKFYILAILFFSLTLISCRKAQPAYVEASGEERDSATLAQDTILSLETIENNKIVSTGTIGGYAFNGKSRKITQIDMMLENGMENLMNDKQYAEIKLNDDVQGIIISIRVLDLVLFKKVPFSYSFTEGKKLIITVFIKNAQGVSEMYGGTIQNVKGRFGITGINYNNNTMIGSLDAELTSVLDNTKKCKVENLRFFNAGFFFSKKGGANDSAIILNKDVIIIQ